MRQSSNMKQPFFKSKVLRFLSITSLVFFASLFLTGCPSGDNPALKEDPNHKGTIGITVAFQGATPPKTVYENDEFNILLGIKNEGAYTLSRKTDETGNFISDDYGIITYSFDPFYFTSSMDDENQKHVYLDGKSTYSPNGDAQTQEYGFKTKKIVGQREAPKTLIIYTFCYPYQTELVQSVCIDKDYYNMDVRKKVCTTKDITLSGGQGAPISITKIEPRVIKQEDNTIIEFVITIQNEAGGNVITRDLQKEVKDQCIEAKPDRDEWNGVAVKAELLGQPLSCTKVKLKDNKGQARCRSGVLNTDVNFTPLPPGAVGPEDIGTMRNFLSTLSIRLDYLYQSSISSQIEIVR
jgi:hypothetical protein